MTRQRGCASLTWKIVRRHGRWRSSRPLSIAHFSFANTEGKRPAGPAASLLKIVLLREWGSNPLSSAIFTARFHIRERAEAVHSTVIPADAWLRGDDFQRHAARKTISIEVTVDREYAAQAHLFSGN